MKQKTYVYILNKQGKPLMPTTRCGKVRKLLKGGKAVVVRSNPFTIRLKYDTDNIVQDLYLGIDTGRENIGVGVSDSKGNCVYLSELKTNNKMIKKNMQERLSFRRERRRNHRITKQRKAIRDNVTIKNGNEDILRTKKTCKSKEISYHGMDKRITHKVIKGKEAKFNNRKREDNWLTPSARQCIQMHMNVVRAAMRLLPISHIVLERVSFDFQKLENENIKAWAYGKGVLYGYKDYKEYINEQQQGKCLLCETNKIEYYHHITKKKDNGIDNVSNIAGLCYDCHYGPKGVHNSIDSEDRLLELKNGLKQKYQIGLLNSVIPTLIENLTSFCKNKYITFSITNGLETSKTRKLLGLSKCHSLDGYCISLSNRGTNLNSIFPKAIYQQQRFKKKSNNNILKRNQREYYYKGKLIAIGRNKATEQKFDSLKEYMDDYLKIHSKLESDRHFHDLVVKPAKRTYTFHKKGEVSPIHTGDLVRYEKHNKIKGNTKRGVFVATGISMSTGHVGEGTKKKKFKYCRRIESGSTPYVSIQELII